MHPALFKLIWLHARGTLRRSVRGATQPKRAIFLAAGIGLVLLWLGPGLLTAMMTRRVDPERVRAVVPMALLGICILTIISSAGDKAISFTPGELDMLFAAPFNRRQLLAYKLTKSTLAAFLTALLLSMAMLRFAYWWVACYVAVFLMLLFVQLFSTAGVLVAQAVSQRAFSMARRIVLAGVAVVAFFGIRAWLAAGGMQGGELALLRFRHSPLGHAVLTPFDSFGQTMTARSAPALVQHAMLAIAIDIALLILVVLLDQYYVEAAMAASGRRYAQLQRIRGGSFLSLGVKGDAQWTLPRFPRLGGAGPIVWRQLTSAGRSARGLFILLLIIVIGGAPVVAALGKSQSIAGPLVGLLVWLTVFLSGMLKFDFRSDIDLMDVLKSLPLRPTVLVAGQVVVPVAILSVTHVLLLLSIAAVVPFNTEVYLAAACLSLPFNALLLTIENLIFLLFPTRPAAVSPGDFQVLGRQTVQLVLKGIAMLFMAGFSIALGAALWKTTGSTLLFTTVAFVLMAAQAVLLIPAVAWAFNRYDPSVDTPA